MEYIADYNDINEGNCKIVSFKGEKILLFKIEGMIYALNNECPHKQAPLGEGEMIGKSIICPKHYWEFDIVTGECLDHEGYCAKKYDVTVVDQKIYIK